MTIAYFGPTRFNSFSWLKRIVFAWKGGVYKLLAVDYFIFLLGWYLLRTFGGIPDDVVVYLRGYQETIRNVMAFMLVFFYSNVYSRAKEIFFSIPWPDNCTLMINGILGSEQNKRGKLVKETLVRYVLSTTFITYHAASQKFRKLYPQPFQSLERLGLLTDHEIEEIKKRLHEFPSFGEIGFLPLLWSLRIIYDFEITAKDGAANTVKKEAIKMIHDYRQKCAALLFQMYLPFPLLLSQIVTITVYAYFVIAVIAQQETATEPHFRFPVFTSLEFFVYMGALRIGAVYINPLGLDDDDYELVQFFNRNLRLAQVHGLFGDESGAFKVDVPPLVSLRQKQAALLRTSVPKDFYEDEFSSTSALGNMLQSSSRVRWPSPRFPLMKAAASGAAASSSSSESMNNYVL